MNSEIQTRPLYQIRQDHINLITLLEESGGNLTPEIEQALQLTNEEFESKAVSYAYVVKGFEDTIQTIDNEIERLLTLKEKAVKRSELFKKNLSDAMQQFGIEKIKTATLSLSFRKSESVEITDASQVPLSCIEEKVIKTISKTKIKEAIKKGMTVPGAQLVTNQNLQIH